MLRYNINTFDNGTTVFYQNFQHTTLFAFVISSINKNYIAFFDM